MTSQLNYCYFDVRTVTIILPACCPDCSLCKCSAAKLLFNSEKIIISLIFTIAYKLLSLFLDKINAEFVQQYTQTCVQLCKCVIAAWRGGITPISYDLMILHTNNTEHRYHNRYHTEQPHLSWIISNMLEMLAETADIDYTIIQ